MPPTHSPTVENYRAVLFDMNGTFMFGGDRFGPRQNYHASYCAVGGTKLPSAAVQTAVSACYAAFLRDYEDPSLRERFPSLEDFIARYAQVPASERGLIAQTIARHEVGKVPAWAARSIRAVAEKCTVAVVSNVWAPSQHWHSELQSSGVAAMFRTTVFSTEVRAIKPSEKPFLVALEALGAAPHEVLFVGDSLERDVLPAQRLGMTTCWVSASAPGSVADFQVPSIAELAR